MTTTEITRLAETLTRMAEKARDIPTRERRPSLIAAGLFARACRKAAKLSLAETARRMQVSAPHLHDLEAGNRQWTMRTLTAWETAISPQPPPAPHDNLRIHPTGRHP